MQHSGARYRLRTLALIVAVLVAATLSDVYGWPKTAKQPSPAVRTTSVDNHEPETHPHLVYLPQIHTPARVSPLQFASTLDNEGNPANPTTTFQYGIEYLYVVTTVENGSGSTWSVQWHLDDTHVPDLDFKGVITSPRERITDFICGVVPSSPRCEALPRGTYRVDFFLNGALRQTGTAVIR